MEPSLAVFGELASLADNMVPWGETEENLSALLGYGTTYLGGDGLRPYVSWVDQDTARFLLVQREQLALPPLAESVLSGAYGLPVVESSSVDHRMLSATLPVSQALQNRLRIPRTLLIGLADAQRYKGARLPLGLARLAQWLRFTHSSRVTIIDYNAEFNPLQRVRQELSSRHYDIVGVSVNFGQWQMLEELAVVVNEFEPSVVVLGNILAAHSPDRAGALFAASAQRQLLIATTLGERPLEALCRQLDDRSAWDTIPGLILPEGKPQQGRPKSVVEPPTVIYPDDAMILDVLEHGGQISLETSFGCQFGACTFCPRDHRGDGWRRAEVAAVSATLERLSKYNAVVSLVDEEFFGGEGIIDPPVASLAASKILSTCRRLGISYEFYTRLEQLFDRRRSRAWNTARAHLLAQEATSMRRVFVGVESGSPSQLRRYGKGQTVDQIVDSLTVGSALGLPLEFGFITFDPLLTANELVENVAFLARTDILAKPLKGSADDLAGAASSYLDGAQFPSAHVPLYQKVAYMATELEVLTHSRYAEKLRRHYPELLTGRSDPNFAREEVAYQDERIGGIAGWCRVWTEGMFVPVYEARMKARTSGNLKLAASASNLVSRYRDATFALLVALTDILLDETDLEVSRHYPSIPPMEGVTPDTWLRQMAEWTLSAGSAAEFDLRLKGRGRQR